MQQLTDQKPAGFVERRQGGSAARNDGRERRQFGNNHSSLRPEVQEFAEAVDRYKLMHRRRFITYEELYDVVSSLGYKK